MSIHDDHLKISTPENVAFSFPVAGIGSRFIAALVDTAAIIALQGVVLVFGGILAGILMGGTADLLDTLSSWIIGILGLVSFVFLWGYYIFFEMLWNGQSPGKRLAKLRVVRRDGGPISLTESVIRNLVRLVDFLPLIYGLGVIVMFVDGKARRLGDLAAGTLVVREATNRYIPTPAGRFSAAAPEIDGLGQLPLERLSPEDLALVESFLRRRNEMNISLELGEQILARLFNRFSLPRPSLDAVGTVQLFEAILAALSNQTDRK